MSRRESIASRTEGPWVVADAMYEVHRKQHSWMVEGPRTDGPHRDVALVFGDDREDLKGRAFANARLIAAAPDMLYRLKDLLVFIEAGVVPPPGKDAEVRALIAKAEGRD